MVGTSFTITEDHIKLLKNMYVGWNGCEFGAPTIDPKRPYGNGDVEHDIARILGWEYDEEDYHLPANLIKKACLINDEMDTVLQICLSTLSFKPGFYTRSTTYTIDWK